MYTIVILFLSHKTNEFTFYTITQLSSFVPNLSDILSKLKIVTFISNVPNARISVVTPVLTTL